MLAKHHRLTKMQFDQFFKTGKRFHCLYFTVVYTPNDTFQAAVVVGKKVHKRAVVRNMLRRRIYAVLYRTLKLSRQTGVYIVLTKPAVHDLSRRELQSNMTDFIATLPKNT